MSKIRTLRLRSFISLDYLFNYSSPQEDALEDALAKKKKINKKLKYICKNSWSDLFELPKSLIKNLTNNNNNN